MRKLIDHIVEGDSVNHQLTIEVLDAPGQGNACHAYEIGGFNIKTNPVAETDYLGQRLVFQNGPIQEVGVNGITNEALLAIVIDRLRGFQSGRFSCRDNAVALTKIEEALMWLQRRTRERIRRGVEGTREQ